MLGSFDHIFVHGNYNEIYKTSDEMGPRKSLCVSEFESNHS